MKKRIIIISIIAVVITMLIVFFLKNSKEKELQFHTAALQKESIEMTVTATGYVQPVDKVDIGTQVSGVIEKIFVDFNSQVKKGQLLAELDKSTLIEKETQAASSLTSAQSDLTFAQQNYDRTKQLYNAKAATETAFEDAINRLEQAKTNVANAKANLHQAKVNLSYAEIYSPIDGVVLNRAVEQGQTVAASFSTPTLFTIANDLKKMQVEANVDEADIGQVKLGQKVTFTVDAYPDNVFEGIVHQIRIQPTVTSNVVTYTVIIEAPNREEKLFPGMTASVTIITRTEEGMAISSEAFHFNPTPDMLSKSDKKNNHSTPNPKGKGKSVWVQTAGGLVQKNVETGLTDGVKTIIKSGLDSTDKVVLFVSDKDEQKPGEAAANPFMPKRPNKK